MGMPEYTTDEDKYECYSEYPGDVDIDPHDTAET
jgi:hypothetical protein